MKLSKKNRKKRANPAAKLSPQQLDKIQTQMDRDSAAFVLGHLFLGAMDKIAKLSDKKGKE